VEWLSKALGGNVSTYTTTILGTGKGFTGQVVRLGIQYVGHSHDAPQTVIAKFPPVDSRARLALNAYRIYEKEAAFYRELAGSINLRTPTPYYVDVDPDTGESVLLLEDLSNARPLNPLLGLTPDEAEFAVVALAQFHASWWESTKLRQYSWLKDFDWNSDAYQERYNATYSSFLETTRDAIPRRLADLGDRLRHHVASIKRDLSRPPITFLHGDFHPNNLFIMNKPRSLAVVDWQICSRGRSARDLMYFITAALPLDARRACDIDLIRKYHAELTANGVTSYPLDQCIRDCRFALLDLMFFMVTIICLLDFYVNDEARGIRALILERFGGAILDHRAEELLP
jgi:hypothetical protein